MTSDGAHNTSEGWRGSDDACRDAYGHGPTTSVDAPAITDRGGERWEGWRGVAGAWRAAPVGALSVTDGWRRLCRGELLFALRSGCLTVPRQHIASARSVTLGAP